MNESRQPKSRPLALTCRMYLYLCLCLCIWWHFGVFLWGTPTQPLKFFAIFGQRIGPRRCSLRPKNYFGWKQLVFHRIKQMPRPWAALTAAFSISCSPSSASGGGSRSRVSLHLLAASDSVSWLCWFSVLAVSCFLFFCFLFFGFRFAINV